MNNQRGFIQIFIGIFALLVGAAFLIAKYHGYQPMKVIGTGMLPSYVEDQSWVIKNYKSGPKKRGDVVAFTSPKNPEQRLFARIVGLPDESIMIKENKVFINGQTLDEPYLSSGTITEPGEFLPEGETKAIPKNQYVMLADNRAYSQDSRDYGFVSKDSIVGKVVFCYYNCSLKAEAPLPVKPQESSSDRRLKSVDQNNSTSQKSPNQQSYQDQRPNLQADAMLNSINQYRQSKNIPTLTKSNELCALAEKRANYLMENNQAATKASDKDYQSKFSEHASTYSGLVVSEIYVTNAWTNNEALDLWKKSQGNNQALLTTNYETQLITHGCVAVRNERSNSVIVFLSGDR